MKERSFQIYQVLKNRQMFLQSKVSELDEDNLRHRQQLLKLNSESDQLFEDIAELTRSDLQLGHFVPLHELIPRLEVKYHHLLN